MVNTQQAIKDALFVVLVLPIDFQLEQINLNGKHYRIAKKAFIIGLKYWMVAIELGNGDFNNILPGLTTNYISYAFFVGQNITNLEISEADSTHGIKPNSVKLFRYIHVPNTIYASYECKSNIYLVIFFKK